MKISKRISVFTSICLLAIWISAFSCPAYGIAMPQGTPQIQSITWQDPQNAVLIWTHTEGTSYNIYRADTSNGAYSLVGMSSSGSYRDNTVDYPKEYFYKIQAISKDGIEGSLSAAMKVGTNPQHVSSVIVLMYHNFVSIEDRNAGILFDEYSISPQAFEEDLLYLKNNGYTTITSKDLLAYMNGEKPLPSKAVILSIDDGTWGVYKHAWPLLQKYNMQADFNVIGEKIDEAWEITHAGQTRNGLAAPYCDWNEILEMCKSGAINLCSHSYKMHRYHQDVRVGAMINDGENIETYINAIKEDYRFTLSCIKGWTDITPKTFSYPYSKRNDVTDAILLGNTSYEILMAGDGVRPTSANYFVDNASKDSYQRLMNRICRMDQTPIETYLLNAKKHDMESGIRKY